MSNADKPVIITLHEGIGTIKTSKYGQAEIGKKYSLQPPAGYRFIQFMGSYFRAWADEMYNLPPLAYNFNTEQFELETLPHRVWRRRKKGWRMPPNTIYVGRGTKWGNPFRVGFDGHAQQCVKKFSQLTKGVINTRTAASISMQRAYPIKDIEELRGKNLSCFCKAGKPCHADILIRLANRED